MWAPLAVNLTRRSPDGALALPQDTIAERGGIDMRVLRILGVAAFVLAHGSIALAQDATAGSPAVAAAHDGLRLRSGISLGGGIEKVSVVSGGMFGLDGRLG